MSTLDELARSRYVSLTTFRRDGVGIDTPVWHAVDGGELFIWTGVDTWKVKRLRNDPRAVVTVCTVRGRIKEGAARAEGAARILESDEDMARIRALLSRKYRWQFWLTEWPARVVRRGKRPQVGIAIGL